MGVYDQFVSQLIEDHPSTQAFREGQQEASQGGQNTQDQDEDLSENLYMMIDDGFDPENNQDPDTSQNMPDLERELKNFKILPTATIQDSRNPLDWWKTYSKSFPLLSEMARNVFCIPTASASSERVFSASGNIITDKRHNLNSETVKKLTLVKVNYEQIHNFMEIQTINPEEEADNPPGPAGPPQPTPGPSGTQAKNKPRTQQGSSGRAVRPKGRILSTHRKRILTYSSSSTTPEPEPQPQPQPEIQPEPMQPPPNPKTKSQPRPMRVTRRTSTTSESDSEVGSQSILRTPKDVKGKRKRSHLSESEILDQLQSPEKGSKKCKASKDLFDDDFDDDRMDPNIFF